MSGPRIHGKTLSASAIIGELGNALSRIRQEDGLTWADIGRVVGKSEDTAAKYADGSAEMGIVAYHFAKREWNGRFTGAADKLIDKASTHVDPHQAQSCILKAALALSIALEDGELSVGEIGAARSTLERSRDAIDALLSRLKPSEVAR